MLTSVAPTKFTKHWSHISPLSLDPLDPMKHTGDLAANTSCPTNTMDTKETRSCSFCGGVPDELYVCGGTCGGTVVYCDRTCQKRHWKSVHHATCGHKHEMILSSSADGSSSAVSVQYGGKRETFWFSTADLCNQWTASYSSLSKSLGERPRDGIAANALLQQIKKFVEEWGKDRLPARTRKAEIVLHELAFRPQGAVIPLDCDSTD